VKILIRVRAGRKIVKESKMVVKKIVATLKRRKYADKKLVIEKIVTAIKIKKMGTKNNK
jgi:hypothetical protein